MYGFIAHHRSAPLLEWTQIAFCVYFKKRSVLSSLAKNTFHGVAEEGLP